MNDKGKTVTTIKNVSPSYARRKGRKGQPDERRIDIKLSFVLADDFPGEHGYAATLHCINTVTDRVINACAQEFLP